MLLQTSDVARATVLFDRAVELRRDRLARDPLNGEALRDLAVLWYKTGLARVRQGPKQPWSQAYQAAIDLMEPLVDDGTAPPGWLRDLAVFRFAYGEALSRAGRTVDARAQWTAALALVEKQLEINPADPRLLADREQLLRLVGGAAAKVASSRR